MLEARTSVPASTIVPPLYVFVLLRINSPPPSLVSDMPGLFSRDATRERQACCRPIRCTFKLSARAKGAVMAWLPLITVKNAVVPELSKVRVPDVPAASV